MISISKFRNKITQALPSGEQTEPEANLSEEELRQKLKSDQDENSQEDNSPQQGDASDSDNSLQNHGEESGNDQEKPESNTGSSTPKSNQQNNPSTSGNGGSDNDPVDNSDPAESENGDASSSLQEGEGDSKEEVDEDGNTDTENANSERSAGDTDTQTDEYEPNPKENQEPSPESNSGSDDASDESNSDHSETGEGNNTGEDTRQENDDFPESQPSNQDNSDEHTPSESNDSSDDKGVSADENGTDSNQETNSQEPNDAGDETGEEHSPDQQSSENEPSQNQKSPESKPDTSTPELSQNSRNHLNNTMDQERREQERRDQDFEQAENTYDDGMGSDGVLDEVKLVPPIPRATTDRWSEGVDLKEDTKSLFLDVLQHEERDEWKTAQKTGMIDQRLLTKVKTNKDFNIKKRRVRGGEKNYYVIIVLDRSHSMGRPSERIEKSEIQLIGFALGLEALGINVCIMDMYLDTPRIISPFNMPVTDSKGELSSGKTGGTTPLGKMINIARERMLRNPDPNAEPFILCITDDRPSDEEAYKNALDDCTMPVLGISIDGGTVDQSELYDVHTTVSSRSNEDLLKNMEELAREVWF